MNSADLEFIRAKKNPINPYKLRHGFALISADQGVDLLTIMESLGHSSIKDWAGQNPFIEMDDNIIDQLDPPPYEIIDLSLFLFLEKNH